MLATECTTLPSSQLFPLALLSLIWAQCLANIAAKVAKHLLRPLTAKERGKKRRHLHLQSWSSLLLARSSLLLDQPTNELNQGSQTHSRAIMIDAPNHDPQRR